MVRLLAALLVFSGAAAVASPPAGAVVAGHDDSGQRLYVADFATGRLQLIGPGQQPVWSPDGLRLAYRIGDRLWLHRGAAPDEPISDGLELETQRPCAFSPRGRTLAVALHGGVLQIGSKRLPARPGLRISDLLWSPGGEALEVLFSAPGRPGHSIAEVIRVELSGRVTQTQRLDDVARFLGWRPNGDLLVLQSGDGHDAAAVLSPAGLRLFPAVAEEVFILDYARVSDRLLLAREGELFLSSLDGSRRSAWVAASDVRLAADGDFALLVKAADGRVGGSIVLSKTGSKAGRSVLSATPARTFSDPVPRPSR
jgi:hypothetical protein